jgi:bacillithiol system protein YtxJ
MRINIMTITPLQSEADVVALMAQPRPVWLFKHSNSCGISSAAHDEVAAFCSQNPQQTVGMVVVQTHRPLSNYVSQKLSFVHQSPQLFLLHNGTVAWTASHWSITASAMTAALATALSAQAKKP